MAQLQWRAIEAPNLSTRDLALAGGQVASSFDRLGSMLAAREASLRQQATDAAIAERLVQQDPNQMGQLNLTGLDKRVDLRALAEADNNHRAQLVERSRANEELLNSQAWAKYGTAIEALGTAALNGDKEAEAQLRSAAGEDPMFARAIGQNEAWSKIVGFRDDRIDNLLERDQFGETQRANKAREAGDAADRALRARALAAEERRQQEADQGLALGPRFAERNRLLDKDSAVAALYDDPEFQKLSPRAQAGVLQTFGQAHAALTGDTQGVRGGLTNLDSSIAGARLRLTAEGNAAENRARDPNLAGLRASAKRGPVTMDEVIGELDGRRGWQSTRGASQAVIQKIMSDAAVTLPNGQVVRPQLSDVLGAIDANGYAEGIGKQIPVWNEWELYQQDKALTDRVRTIVTQRGQGYSANEDVDVAAARAPIAAKEATIARDREQLTRFLRADARGQLTPTQRLEMEKLERRLAERLQE